MREGQRWKAVLAATGTLAGAGGGAAALHDHFQDRPFPYAQHLSVQNSPARDYHVPDFPINRVFLPTRAWELVLGSSHSDTLPPNLMRVEGVIPIVYRSGAVQEHFLPALKEELGIRTVIVLKSLSDELRAKMAAAGIIVIHLPTTGREMNIHEIRRAVAHLLNAQDPVLVYCHGGADRTGMIIAALRASLGQTDVNGLQREMRYHGHLPFIPKYNHFPALLERTVQDIESNPISAQDLQTPDSPIFAVNGHIRGVDNSD